MARSWPKAGPESTKQGAKKAVEAIIHTFARFCEAGGGQRARWHRGGTREAPRRHRGGNGALGGLPYEVLGTTNRSSEDLTRRWAKGPANF